MRTNEGFFDQMPMSASGPVWTMLIFARRQGVETGSPLPFRLSFPASFPLPGGLDASGVMAENQPC